MPKKQKEIDFGISPTTTKKDVKNILNRPLSKA